MSTRGGPLETANAGARSGREKERRGARGAHEDSKGPRGEAHAARAQMARGRAARRTRRARRWQGAACDFAYVAYPVLGAVSVLQGGPRGRASAVRAPGLACSAGPRIQSQPGRFAALPGRDSASLLCGALRSGGAGALRQAGRYLKRMPDTGGASRPRKPQHWPPVVPLLPRLALPLPPRACRSIARAWQ